MADRIDTYSFFLSFVTSLENGIHSNNFSKRGKTQNTEIKQFLEAASAQEEIVRQFSIDLYEAVQRCIILSCATVQQCRERSSKAFYQLQLKVVIDLWHKVHRELSLQPPNPLWPQTISRLIFEDSLAKRLSETRNKGAVSTEESAVIQADQENALRYPAGFVPFKLLKSIRRKTRKKLLQL